MKFKIKEVKPKIFLASFEDQYDMCMTFLRCQETYESPKFRNKSFKILDFMEWYAKKQGNGVFSYPVDWSGFNCPSNILYQAIKNAYSVKDFNEYDEVMEEIYDKCLDKLATLDDKFYLIGALKGNDQVVQHEVAHGLWYTVPAYKKEMLTLVKKMKPALRKKLCQELVKLGYTKQVFDDECHAYMSTGLSEKSEIILKGEDKPFIETFKRYYNE